MYVIIIIYVYAHTTSRDRSKYSHATLQDSFLTRATFAHGSCVNTQSIAQKAKTICVVYRTCTVGCTNLELMSSEPLVHSLPQLSEGHTEDSRTLLSGFAYRVQNLAAVGHEYGHTGLNQFLPVRTGRHALQETLTLVSEKKHYTHFMHTCMSACSCLQ